MVRTRKNQRCKQYMRKRRVVNGPQQESWIRTRGTRTAQTLCNYKQKNKEKGQLIILVLKMFLLVDPSSVRDDLLQVFLQVCLYVCSSVSEIRFVEYPTCMFTHVVTISLFYKPSSPRCCLEHT